MRTILVSLLLAPMAMAAEPKQRTFQFDYNATIVGLKPGSRVSIWVPVAQTSDDQTVLKVETTLPDGAKQHLDPVHGNAMYHVEATANKEGKVPLGVRYLVRRREVIGETDRDLTEKLDRFLKPDPLVPEKGKYLALLEGRKLSDDQLKLGRELYDIVNGLMRYAKDGTEWGRGDVEWACESRFGNCTDFHSLFTALCRSKGIPARFEIGFGLPADRTKNDVAGYHCWAKFKPTGKGWVPVDISEANKSPELKEYYFGNLTADRITFTTGRGLSLVPKQSGPPLNFFIYPYAEVDGKPLPAEQIERRFRVIDAPAKTGSR